MIQQGPIPLSTFHLWLFQEKANRLLLWLSSALTALSFAWVKILYPYPNFIPPDSHSYIRAAYTNDTISMWPTGYSQFLRLVSCFSHSHFILVFIQYLLLQAALLYLLFTVQYRLRLRQKIFGLIVVCSLLNPLLPQLSNFVSSDSLFLTLSLLWLAQLLWLLFRPGRLLLISHALVLLLALTVRHQALYYPAISLLALWLTHAPATLKRTGAVAILLTTGTYIGYIQYQYEQLTGKVQYAPFGGWQLAANALYGYAHTQPDSTRIPYKFRALHALANRHMDSLRRQPNRPVASIGIYYLWNDRSPLQQYLRDHKPHQDSSASQFQQWATLGPLYGAYGRFLIRKHPGSFLRHYAWPNLKNYISPPAGFMGYYNLQRRTVPPIVVSWFGWSNNRLPSYFNDKKIQTAEAFTFVVPVIHLVYLGSFFAFLFTRGLRQSFQYAHGLLWWIFFVWLINMCFSVFAAPIELRYQLLPLTVQLLFSMVQIEQVILSTLLKREKHSNHYPTTQPIAPATLPSINIKQ